MPVVSTTRVWALRCLYLILAVGLGFVIWPSILSHGASAPTPSTALRSLLGSIGLLAVLGLRYPLQMIPLLVFELLWKVVWAVAYALPAWSNGQLGAYGESTLLECAPAFVLFPLVLPWRYIFHRYVKAPAEPWREQRSTAEGAA